MNGLDTMPFFSLWWGSGPVTLQMTTWPLCGPAHCVVVVGRPWSSDRGFDGSAVVCLAAATCMLSICRLGFGTVNALWELAFYFVSVPKPIQQWCNRDVMLLSQPVSSELCVSRCYRHMSHLHCRKASCLGYYLKEKTALRRCEAERRLAFLNIFILFYTTLSYLLCLLYTLISQVFIGSFTIFSEACVVVWISLSGVWSP